MSRAVAVVLFVTACSVACGPSGSSRAAAQDASGRTRDESNAAAYAEIRVVDGATGRGVPLAELETVNHLRFVTDNAGRVAFNEPGLMGREVFFTVRSHGYGHNVEVRRS
jgi:hypothetical protein